ncbi:MAG: hypothetical protein ACMXX8_00025 [Candidatus Woesearchaeota archaeon]
MNQFKRNLNMFLTIMLIVVLLGLVFMTLFFQITVNNLNEKYLEKSDELDETLLQLDYYIDKYENLNFTLYSLSSDLVVYTEEFEETYSQLSDEKSQLSLSLNDTQNLLLQTQNELESKLNKLRDIRSKILSLNSNTEDVIEDIQSIEEMIGYIKSDSKKLYDYIDENYDNNLTVNEYLEILSETKKEANSLRLNSRDSNDEIIDIIDDIKDLKNKINEIFELISGY